MAGIRRAGAVAVALVALAAMTACSATVGGRGTASSPVSSSGGFPSQSVTVTAPPSTSASSSLAPVPTEAQRDAQLTAQTNGETHVIVQVPAGYQAATYDQGGNIQFWSNPEANLIWTQVGQSSYPLLPDATAPDVSLIGTDLTGMQDATWIAHGLLHR